MNFSFSEEYKNWSNEKLFDLLKNQELYQTAAVAAAEFEFGSRSLTESEIELLENQHVESLLNKQSKLKKFAKKKVEAAKEIIQNDTDVLRNKSDDLRLR